MRTWTRGVLRRNTCGHGGPPEIILHLCSGWRITEGVLTCLSLSLPSLYFVAHASLFGLLWSYRITIGLIRTKHYLSKVYRTICYLISYEIAYCSIGGGREGRAEPRMWLSGRWWARLFLVSTTSHSFLYVSSYPIIFTIHY